MSALAAPSRSFLCLRHGVTEWNRDGRFQGRTDNPLNEDGLVQAHAAARRLQAVRLGHVVTSPLARAMRTAEIIATASSKLVTIDDDLIECDFGSFEGKPVRETMAQHGVTTAEGLVSILPEDAEPWAIVSQRSLRCVSLWLERHRQGEILFVCHDGVMQAMAQVLCGGFFKNSHGVPFRFAPSADVWTVEEVV